MAARKEKAAQQLQTPRAKGNLRKLSPRYLFGSYQSCGIASGFHTRGDHLEESR